MADAVMSCEGVRTAEGLFFRAQVATNFLFSRVVNCVFVAGEVVRSGKDGMAWFTSTRIDPITSVWARLAVKQAVWCGDNAGIRSSRTAESLRLPMALALVLLQQCRRLETQRTAVIGTGVCATIGGGANWLNQGAAGRTGCPFRRSRTGLG